MRRITALTLIIIVAVMSLGVSAVLAKPGGGPPKTPPGLAKKNESPNKPNGSSQITIHEWDGRGTDSLKCENVDGDRRTEAGWMHWVFSTKGSSSDAELILKINGDTHTFGPDHPLNANVWHFYTPYFDVDNLEAKIKLKGSPGPGGGLVISDYCPGGVEELEVKKTAKTFFKRTHDWSIAKSVKTEKGYDLYGVPKIWLYTDGRGNETATWKVNVTYEGYQDSKFKVFGDVTIKNTGSLDAVITDVTDVFGETVIEVDCGEDVDFAAGYLLEVGDELECSYSEKLDGKVTGTNTATVTTERDEYTGEAEVTWGDPAVEKYAAVEVLDTNEAFSAKYGLTILNASNYNAGDVEKFTYSEDFAYADYEECGAYQIDNTATVMDTVVGKVFGEAHATLKINVQCFVVGAGDTAWAANGDTPLEIRYQNPGNWATYVEYFDAEKTTTLFRGQTTNVGTVTFSEPVDGNITITINLNSGFAFGPEDENLKIQDYSSAPSGNPAPGQFDHKFDCETGATICVVVVPQNGFYGVHAEIGDVIPDPNFGP